jgi:hypothetical protein
MSRVGVNRNASSGGIGQYDSNVRTGNEAAEDRYRENEAAWPMK